MTKGLIVGFLTILISACGGTSKAVIENLLLAQFQSFKLDADLHGLSIENNSVDIQFGSPGVGITAVCIQYSGANSKVIIDSTKWNEMTESQRKTVFYHEMGHCFLDRNHLEDTTVIAYRTETPPTETPLILELHNSLMHSTGVNPVIYKQHEEYFIDELFDPSEAPEHPHISFICTHNLCL